MTRRAKQLNPAVMGHSKRTDMFPAERVIAFSDGVIAVAITLLVLDLKLPEGVSAAGLGAALQGLERPLWCYVLSFMVIGVLWMTHHQHFAYIGHVDAAILWMNLLLLMTIALIPFVTSVMSDNDNPLSTMLYAAVLTASCALIAGIWWHATRRPELLRSDVSAEDRRLGVLVPLMIAGIFAVSIPIAYSFGSSAGQWTWLLAAAAGPLAARLPEG